MHILKIVSLFVFLALIGCHKRQRAAYPPPATPAAEEQSSSADKKRCAERKADPGDDLCSVCTGENETIECARYCVTEYREDAERTKTDDECNDIFVRP